MHHHTVSALRTAAALSAAEIVRKHRPRSTPRLDYTPHHLTGGLR